MILVTGASGFIGKHLIKFLIRKFGKDHILALTSKPIAECNYLLHHNYQFEENYFVKNGFNDIQVIIHAGAFTPKNNANANDVQLCNANIFNTELLLKAKHPKLRKIIYLSTLDIYKNEEIISESTIEKPYSLYGFSKLYSEKMIESWGKMNNKIIQILRIGHVYGPGEEAYQKIIPLSIKKCMGGQNLQIWGSGDELRSFIYIDDVVEAIANAVTLNNDIGVVNLVGGQSISMNELLEIIIGISKTTLEIEKIETENLARNLVFDNAKMINFLLTKETPLLLGLQKEFEYMQNIVA